MSSEAEILHVSPKRAPPVPPTRRSISHRPSTSNPPAPTTVFSIYRMNDIPRGTPRSRLINSLLSPTHDQDRDLPSAADVQFGLLTSDSRLDDELSVAMIEFSNTPLWLQALNNDPHGFPKKTPFGTLWRGVDPNATDEHRQSAFITAVMAGATDIYYPEMMAEFEDTDVNIQDDQGRTALHWACAMDLSVMVKLCLSVPDCDVGLKDNDGLTAFDLAQSEKIQHHFYRSVFEMEETDDQEALLRVLTLSSVPAGDDKPVFPGAALFQPVEQLNTRLVAALVHRRVDLTARNERGDTALHVAAAQSGAVEIATLLVNAGADVNALGNGGATPLHCAARGGQLDVARVLLENGAVGGVRNGGGSTALQLAEGRHDQELVALLEGAMDIDEHPEVGMVAELHTPIGVIAPDIELKNDKGRTRLQQAVTENDLDRVRELVLMGADMEVKDQSGNTALLRAARGCSWIIFNALLDMGAEPRATSNGGVSALHWAVIHRHTETIISLIANHVDIDAGCELYGTQGDERGTSGNTALMLAASVGLSDDVRVLVKHGANVDARNGAGMTALKYALQNRNVEGATIILDAGAHCSASQRVRYIALRAAQFRR